MEKPRPALYLFVRLYLFLCFLGFRHIPKFKGLFFRIYSAIPNKSGVVYIPTIDKTTITIDLRDTIIATKLLEYGEWEHALTTCIKQRVRPGMRVLDVGAHVGYYSTLFSDLVGESGEVISFEPEPYNFSLLQINMRNKKNAVLVNKAVSDVSGTARLHLDSENFGGHSLHTASSQFVDVETIRLDAYIKKNEKIDFIKMDIEGNEHQALAGMGALLSQPTLSIVFEYIPELVRDPEALFNTLRGYGFSLFEIPHRTGALVEIRGVPNIPNGANANIFCSKK